MWLGFQSQGDLGPLGSVDENFLRSPKQESPLYRNYTLESTAGLRCPLSCSS